MLYTLHIRVAVHGYALHQCISYHGVHCIVISSCPGLRLRALQVVLAWSVAGQMPPCEDSAVPPIAGYVSQNNLVLDEGHGPEIAAIDSYSKVVPGHAKAFYLSCQTILHHFTWDTRTDMPR